MLTNNWRWRTAEQYSFPNPTPPPASIIQSYHSGNYAAAISPYVNNNGADNLMAAGSVRTIPATVDQAAPQGVADQIHFNIGSNNANPPDANQVTFQISSMYNSNTQVTDIIRDDITVTVGNVTSAPFGWGLPQTVNNALVNQAARISSPFLGTTATEALMFHYRNPGVFVQGGGLELGFGDIDSVKYRYSGVGALSVMTVDNVLDNPGVFTSLTDGVHYTSTVDFLGGKINSASVSFTNLPAGRQDILLMLSMAIVIPEPTTGTLLMLAIGILGLRSLRLGCTY